MSLESLRDLYVHELRDLYNAETQLIKALPKMAKAASAPPELRAAFEEHLIVTKRQVERLDQIFEALDGARRGRNALPWRGSLKKAKK